MKKLVAIIAALMIIIFILPLLFTRRSVGLGQAQDLSLQNEEQDVLVENYDYSKCDTIKLLHKKTDKIEQVPLDEYIVHVVSAEMPVRFGIEALKAQSIVARTYTIYKVTTSSKHKGADICDDSTCCQAWISKEDRFNYWKETEAQENWNKIVKAVNETKGKIITYQGKPINAFFHANSGGKTEVPFFVWGGSNYPYLQVVETSGEANYKDYQSEASFTQKELEKIMKSKYKNFKINFKEKDCIRIEKRDSSDRVITVKIGNVKLSGVETRSLLKLRSTNFTVETKDNKIKFSVVGYGHGVGMSQTGADALAKQGKKCEEIIKHFYKDVEITEM